MVVADSRSTADSIGDEPYQIFRKFPHIMLVADSDRVRAVKYLMAQEVKPDIIWGMMGPRTEEACGEVAPDLPRWSYEELKLMGKIGRAHV